MADAEVYSALKALHFADRLQALADDTVPAPVHVRIKPINRCNHGCWFCAYRADHMQLGEEMREEDSIPRAKMFEIVNDLIDMGVKAVTFSGGGEPLLYKALPDVVDRLGEHGIKVGCLTNGANLQGRYADALAAHGTWVRISLDGWDDESYAKSRGTHADAFSRMMRNIRAFADRGSRCVIGASFVIGRDNHGHVTEACRLLKRAGVHHVKLSGAVVSNDIAENNAYHAPLFDAVRQQITDSRALEDDTFRLVDHYHRLHDCFDKSYASCLSARLLTVIGADQTVYACQDKAYTATGALGSIGERSFKEFWFSDENRQRLDGIDPRRDCRHHCVSHAKNTVLQDFFSLDVDHLPFV